MKTELIECDDLFITGKYISLQEQLSQNQKIATSFWHDFNTILKKQHRPPQKNWVKYGCTRKTKEGYIYFCGLPSQGIYPHDFEIYRIPRGTYLKCIHTGPMSSLKETIRYLWEVELPKQNIQRLENELVYYEKYTDGFHFESEQSTIELYIPIVTTINKPQPIIAKTLLQGKAPQADSKVFFTWFGMDYNMNLYKGCSHGCIYCDSRSSCYQIKDFDIIHPKENALILLENELRKKRKRGTIGIGAMSDTYNPFEKEYEITRGALELIRKYGFGVGIDTKSDMILRDISLLKQIAQQYPSIIKITITTADDEVCKVLEPNVCVSSKRFKAIQQLSEAGLFVGILLMPILPFINDSEENILSIVRLAHKHKAKFIFVYGGFGVTLRDNQRDYFYYQLDRYFPGKREVYEKRYHNVYSCNSPHSKHLYALFQKECKKYGILYKMSDIVRAYKNVVPNEQLTLAL